MPRVTIDWEELNGERLPFVCYRCGADADKFFDVEVEADKINDIITGEHGFLTIKLPLCREHGKRGKFTDHGVRAAGYTDDEIEFKNACDGFADALADYRKDPERFDKRQRTDERAGRTTTDTARRPAAAASDRWCG